MTSLSRVIALVDPALRYNPTVATLIGVEAQVAIDIADRQATGIEKYSMTLADNPASLRARLQHACEECLDQALYLRWAIAEIDAKNITMP